MSKISSPTLNPALVDILNKYSKGSIKVSDITEKKLQIEEDAQTTKTTLTHDDIRLIVESIEEAQSSKVKAKIEKLQNTLEILRSVENPLCVMPPIPSEGDINYGDSLELFKAKMYNSEPYITLFASMVNANVFESNEIRVMLWAFIHLVEECEFIPKEGYSSILKDVDSLIEKWKYKHEGNLSKVIIAINEKKL